RRPKAHTQLLVGDQAATGETRNAEFTEKGRTTGAALLLFIEHHFTHADSSQHVVAIALCSNIKRAGDLAVLNRLHPATPGELLAVDDGALYTIGNSKRSSGDQSQRETEL